ncbi:MAG: PepSY domain-containing protein, partial [bacterium]
MPSRKMSPRKTTFLLLRWHRRIGLTVAIFALLLAITGIALNHTSSLALGKIRLGNPVILHLYKLDTASGTPQQTGYRVDGAGRPEQWVYLSGLQLTLNEQPVAACEAPLRGAAQFDGLIVSLCRDELIVLDGNGHLIERISEAFGLPAGASRLGLSHGNLIVGAMESGSMKTTLWLADLDKLSFQTEENLSVDWINPQTLPDHYRVEASTDQASVSLETLLLDIHSGRILGGFGVLLMDIAGLLMIVLGISG